MCVSVEWNGWAACIASYDGLIWQTGKGGLRYETQRIQVEGGQPPESLFGKGDFIEYGFNKGNVKIPLGKGGEGVVFTTGQSRRLTRNVLASQSGSLVTWNETNRFLSLWTVDIGFHLYLNTPAF